MTDLNITISSQWRQTSGDRRAWGCGHVTTYCETAIRMPHEMSECARHLASNLNELVRRRDLQSLRPYLIEEKCFRDGVDEHAANITCEELKKLARALKLNGDGISYYQYSILFIHKHGSWLFEASGVRTYSPSYFSFIGMFTCSWVESWMNL